MADGKGYGANGRAMIITRGELCRQGMLLLTSRTRALPLQLDTFVGIAAHIWCCLVQIGIDGYGIAAMRTYVLACLTKGPCACVVLQACMK
jgi:hypothetical protein